MTTPEANLPSTVPPPDPSLILSLEDAREFQTIVREETGATLTLAESSDRLIELETLVRMLLGPYPEDRTG